jgi:DNA-binding CsgD family transcriptional regulator/sugar-specific transcriptional regulator TrmB
MTLRQKRRNALRVRVPANGVKPAVVVGDDRGVLEALGLSATEQALYELLLTRPPITLPDLRALVADRVWAGSAERALRRLEESGLVARLPEDPPCYVVVPADAGLEALIAARERALAAARQRMNQLTARYRQAALDGDPLALVEVVHGREVVSARLAELLQRTRGEFRAIDAPPYLSDPRDPTAKEMEQLGRGVRYRIIYDRQAVSVPGRLPELQSSVNAGEEARVTDVSLKLGINDEPVAMLPLRTDPVDLETWLVVHDSVLLDALSALFEMYWERAVPLHVRHDRPDRPDLAHHDGPTDTERTLLSLLAAGLTDQAIADHLGWHERTAHRHLRATMRRLDAATRFQAGYQAVRRGWLAPPGEGRGAR